MTVDRLKNAAQEQRLPRSGGLVTALAISLSIALLQGCASQPKPRPQFPPHLAHLIGHPFFAEQCDQPPPDNLSFTIVAKNGNATQIGDPLFLHRRAQRCQFLLDDLNIQIAHFNERFRQNNRCVSHSFEVNGQLLSDTRECRIVQEGYAARPASRKAMNY